MEEYISRQEAIANYQHVCVTVKCVDCPFRIEDGEFTDCRLERFLHDLPSAQRKGKWIATQEWGGRNYSCSCCKFSFMVDTCMLEPMWNFCPNCGAEMEKGEKNENKGIYEE